VVLISSAGNLGDEFYYYPASFASVMSVAATDESEKEQIALRLMTK
jgi:hypothetical protein